EADGLLELDSDGDGQADDAARLAELGIDEAERITLSERFEPGDSFIRLRMKHFSSWDANWGFSPPSDAIGPYRTPSQGGDPKGCVESGSVIDVHNQILGEDLALAGLPFGLHYRSDRVPGRKIAYSLKIPLVGPEAPASLKGIELALQVAGQQHEWHFDADPDPSTQVDFHEFTWDGKDAYGRRLQGAHPVTVRIGYTYDGVMQANERFGYSGNGAEITASQTRQDITLWLEWKGTLGAADARPSGLGGWSLGIHHAYDPNGRILYRGDGGRRSADRLEPIVRTVAGGGTVDPKFASVGDLLALDANFKCEDVAVGPDGSLYIASAHQVYRVDPEGLIHLVAGAAGPEPGSDGEGILATEAWISYVSSISLDRQGVLYFSSYTEDRVRKVTSDGRIWTVAGNLNEPGYTGDGGPAEEALLDEPVDILAASDGSLYIAEMNNCIIRRIGTDGLIHTVAGQVGVWSHEGPGDGGPAVDAVLDMQVDDLAEGPDGSIYFVELWAQRIRRIDLSGKIDTVAGRGVATYENDGDGGPALEAGIRYPRSIAIGRDSSLYIATQNTIRKVGPDGIITTLAGTGESNASGDGGPASQASFSNGEGMALDAEGTLYYADESSNDNRIRSITSPLPGFMDLADEIVLPSQNGMEVFLFDAQGRHLQTLHGLTGAVLWAFEYAEDGKLAAITDGDGNRTEIDGFNPSSFSIIPPFAQPTHIDVDDEGFIQNITDPAGRVFGFTYLQEGLLTSMRDPKGQAYEFRYDSLGRLTRDEDPAGGFKEIRLDEDSLADGNIIELETAEGRVSNYRSERLSNGSWEKVNTFPGGLINRLIDKGGTSSELYLADGSRRDTQLGADSRLGMGAPLVTQQRLLTPAGLQLQMEQSREVESSSGAGLFDFDRITDTLTVNGKTSTSSYQASDRRLTLTTPTGRQLTGIIDEQGRPLQAEIVDSGIWPVEQSYDEFGRLLEIAQGADAERRTSSIA
ncbi:MAG: hypothetical protein JRF33_27105, partial [Deltaproteobacteria bacterium]|nr:hypothetical protein [Deltaproteobacteria bacterium]